MCKRFAMLLGAMLVLSGCDLFQDPSPPLPPPGTTCEEVPACCDYFHRPYLEVAQQVPGFGGMFFDEQDNSILYVYLTDLSQEDAVKQAIREIFGPRWLELYTYPQEIHVLQGQYTYLQLKVWFDCLTQWVFAIRGVTSLDLDEGENRVAVGIDIGLKAAKKHRVIETVETILERLGIPREAVILEFEHPPVLKRSS